MRRIFIIIATVVVVVGIAVAVYFVFFAPKGPSLTVGNTLPLAGSAPGASVGQTPSATQTSGAGTEVAPRLIKITDGPVAKGLAALDVLRTVTDASASATTTTGATSTPDAEVRYIDRASGNVYSFDTHARALTRLSNKTLPGIQKASWLADGSMAYVQFLSNDPVSNTEQVMSYALPSDGEGGYFLEQGLAQILASGTNSLFSLLSSTDGSVGTAAKADGTGVRTVFSSPISSLVVSFGGATIVANTKASAGLDGYAFTVNSKTGSFTRILGPLRGLSVLPSPSGALLLYSYVDRGAIHLGVLDIATHSAIALPLATLSEKCAWSSDSSAVYCGVPKAFSGSLPDDWYQGAVSFSDRLWRIDLSQRVAKLVIDPSTAANTAIDIIAPTIDPKTDVIFFMNKANGSLWAYDL